MQAKVQGQHIWLSLQEIILFQWENHRFLLKNHRRIIISYFEESFIYAFQTHIDDTPGGIDFPLLTEGDQNQKPNYEKQPRLLIWWRGNRHRGKQASGETGSKSSTNRSQLISATVAYVSQCLSSSSSSAWNLAALARCPKQSFYSFSKNSHIFPLRNLHFYKTDQHRKVLLGYTPDLTNSSF